MCMRAGQGVSDPSHPLHQTALSANGLQVSTASETFFLECHNITHFHLGIFYVSRTLMFASQALGGGLRAVWKTGA